MLTNRFFVRASTRPETPLEQEADIINPGPYAPNSGFAVLLDFVAGVPDSVSNVGMVYGLFDAGNAVSQPQSTKCGSVSVFEQNGSRCAPFASVRFCGI